MLTMGKKKVKHTNFVSENLYPRKSFFKNLVFSDPEHFLHVKKKKKAKMQKSRIMIMYK